jgi:hypothetical protein
LFIAMVRLQLGDAHLLSPLAHRVSYPGRRRNLANQVKISGNGSNALDFHIAYYIGKLAATKSTAFFHIVSKDTGFDPLVQHLKSQGVLAGRVKDITDIPLLKASVTKTPADRNQVALTWLQQMKASKPRTVKTLSSSIGALFQKQLTEEQVSGIVQWLSEQGHIVVTGTKVSYAASGGAFQETRAK